MKNEKILNFENNEQELFSIIRYNELRNKLLVELKKKKFFNIKKKNVTEDLFKKKYNLIFNCESHNFITKKFFSKQIKKDYKSFAHTAIIKHKRKEKENKVAVQIFTLNGPIAFLPISETETSVVYSTKNKKKIDLRKEIKRFNTQYKILKITKPSFFQLKLVNLRIYKYKNILAFGDLLHKIHPLAGQGFNMNLRDLKEILSLIDLRISNGLQLDSSICKDFEKKTRHRNYLFSNGIDLIYEIFNLESKLKKKIISRYIQILGKNKILNNFFKSIADKGLRV